MMKRLALIAAAFSGVALYAHCSSDSSPQTFVIFNATNSLSVARESAAAQVPLKLFMQGSTPYEAGDLLVTVDGNPVPSQVIDSDADGELDALLFVRDYAASEVAEVTVSWLAEGQIAHAQEARTYAELAVRIGGKLNEKGRYKGGNYVTVSEMTMPDYHKVGNKLFKYEGFGWESSKVGYRYYFDDRGSIDIFGKRVTDIVLPRVGLDSGNYHKMADWGLDVLKVGPSLGMGGFAAWTESGLVKPSKFDKLSMKTQNGALQSGVEVTHTNWDLEGKKADLVTRFSILADSRLTHVQARAAHAPKIWAAGIVKHGVERLENLSAESEWNYIATFGEQSLSKDNLGMVVFFRHSQLKNAPDDEYNELVLLKNDGSNRLDYYFGASWQAEPNGVASMEAFKAQLESLRQELNNPIAISPAN